MSLCERPSDGVSESAVSVQWPVCGCGEMVVSLCERPSDGTTQRSAVAGLWQWGNGGVVARLRWIGCPRRCNLTRQDDSLAAENHSGLVYALRPNTPSVIRMRKRHSPHAENTPSPHTKNTPCKNHHGVFSACSHLGMSGIVFCDTSVNSANKVLLTWCNTSEALGVIRQKHSLPKKKKP